MPLRHRLRKTASAAINRGERCCDGADDGHFWRLGWHRLSLRCLGARSAERALDGAGNELRWGKKSIERWGEWHEQQQQQQRGERQCGTDPEMGARCRDHHRPRRCAESYDGGDGRVRCTRCARGRMDSRFGERYLESTRDERRSAFAASRAHCADIGTAAERQWRYDPCRWRL